MYYINALHFDLLLCTNVFLVFIIFLFFEIEFSLYPSNQYPTKKKNTNDLNSEKNNY